MMSAPQKGGRPGAGCGSSPAPAACSPVTLWCWIHGPAKHHVVILVSEVVAMCDVGSRERAEVAVELNFLARLQRDHVFAPDVFRVMWIQPGRHAVARDHPVLLVVHVHRMDPPAAAVAHGPDLRLAERGERERDGRVELLAVDQPFPFAAEPAAALQLEGARAELGQPLHVDHGIGTKAGRTQAVVDRTSTYVIHYP